MSLLPKLPKSQLSTSADSDTEGSDDEKDTVWLPTDSREPTKSLSTPNDNKTVVLVTGCSSGLGKEVTLNLIKDKNLIIFATMRNKMSAKGKALMRELTDEAEAMLNVLEMDVTNSDEVDAAIQKIYQRVGRVDVLINNAGYGMIGPAEVQSMDDIKEMFDTNFFGAFSLIQKLVPKMRERRNGRVINITGVAGATGKPFEACYSASKFALEGLVNSMAPVYRKFNVHFSNICPGDIVTDFSRNQKQPALSVNKATGHMDWSNVPDDLMEQFGTYLCSSMLARKTQSQSALEVSRIILKCIKEKTPALRYETSTHEVVKKAYEIARGTDRNGNRLVHHLQTTSLAEKSKKPTTEPPKRRASLIASAGASFLRRATSFRKAPPA